VERIISGRSATLTHTFYSARVATDPSPDSATVTITRADGTALVTNAATTGTIAGSFAYTFNPGDIAQVDNLTARWTSALGTVVTYVEIVGGFLFGLAALKSDLQTPGNFTTDQLVAIRTLAEDALEDACGVAFVPRLRTETLSGTGAVTTILDRPYVRAIRSASIDGVALTSTELLALRYSQSGTIYNASRWTAGWGNTVVVYEHGHSHPPERVSRACRLLAKTWLVRGPVDERATQMATEVGTINLATPGRFGSTFGIPEVDAVVAEYGLKVAVA
jgi:hypothetical protein